MPQAHFYLGMACLLSEKYVYALHAFSDAYSRDSSYVESLYNIGVIYDRMGNRAKARLYYNRYNHEKERGRDRIF
jgi:TolA-binding protein